jgi:hypothetical protein
MAMQKLLLVVIHRTNEAEDRIFDILMVTVKPDVPDLMGDKIIIGLWFLANFCANFREIFISIRCVIVRQDIFVFLNCSKENRGLGHFFLYRL